jgi:mRNA interferase HigB
MGSSDVISKGGLLALLKGKSSDVREESIAWYKVARLAQWNSLQDVRRDFPDADQVGSVLIFNIRGNRYRLIVFEVFAKNKLYVKALLTHKEYDREEWKKWA